MSGFFEHIPQPGIIWVYFRWLAEKVDYGQVLRLVHIAQDFILPQVKLAAVRIGDAAVALFQCDQQKSRFSQGPANGFEYAGKSGMGQVDQGTDEHQGIG